MLLLRIFSFQLEEPPRISCKAGPAVGSSLRITLSGKMFLTEGFFFFFQHFEHSLHDFCQEIHQYCYGGSLEGEKFIFLLLILK